MADASTRAKRASLILTNNVRNSLKFVGQRIGSVFEGREGSQAIFSAVEEAKIPEAKVDIALVGVEHSGKSTFFKQITSLYTPEDFRMLMLSDGRSQAIGTLLKITLTLLKPCLEELETLEAREAAEELLHALALYNLDAKASKALKVVWSDPVFLNNYKKSAYFQPRDFMADVANCDILVNEGFLVPKQLHLKLHNATHGYNSTRFSFYSEVPVEETEIDSHGGLIHDKAGVKSIKRVSVKESKRNSHNDKTSSGNSEIVRSPSNKNPRGSVIGTMVASTSRQFRKRVSQVFLPNRNDAEEHKTQKRKNEVRIWDIGGLFERRTDWEYFLRRSNVAMFFCSLSDYAVSTSDGSNENLLQDSLNMFQVLCESDFLKNRVLHVVLTKKDILYQKLKKFSIPLNHSGLFPDAPSGEHVFDVDANIEFVKEMFLKITETSNSFLTRENIVFKAINSFEEQSVKDFFLEAINSVKAESPRSEVSDVADVRERLQTEQLIETLKKEAEEKSRASRGFSLHLRGFSFKKGTTSNTGSYQHFPLPSGSEPPKKLYTNNEARRSKKGTNSQNSKRKTATGTTNTMYNLGV